MVDNHNREVASIVSNDPNVEVVEHVALDVNSDESAEAVTNTASHGGNNNAELKDHKESKVGMIMNADVLVGKKSIMSFLLKPILKTVQK
jgi:hypothetical protein